jgi:hypothetical protein
MVAKVLFTMTVPFLGFARSAPSPSFAARSELAEVFGVTLCGYGGPALVPHEGGGAHALLTD